MMVDAVMQPFPIDLSARDGFGDEWSADIALFARDAFDAPEAARPIGLCYTRNMR
jgi:hypothetical protein